MNKEMIHLSVPLVAILMDSTTGYKVDCPQTVFYGIYDDVKIRLRYIYKGNGIFVFKDLEQKDFILQFDVPGYISVETKVCLDELPSGMPVKQIFIVPSETSPVRDGLLCLKGNIKGLTQISGFNVDECVAHALRFDAQRVSLSIFEDGQRLNIDGVPFGVLNVEKEEFEQFYVKSVPRNNNVILVEPLERDVVRNSPIARLSFGYVDLKGNYYFKILQRPSIEQVYLLEFVIDGKRQYRKVDFHRLEEEDWHLQL